MTERTTTRVRDFLQGVTGGQPDEQAPDRDLIHRFVEHRDDGAFAILVRRYSATVIGVALRVLGNRADAEDVSQATFLILARKASQVNWRASVAGWLYGVAYHLARRACRSTLRRAAGEGESPAKRPPDVVTDVTLRELQQALDEELARLPEKYRAPVLLCCLEGKTRDEAAQRLGLSLSRVKSRLEEGRERLRRRLTRRGIQLSVAFAGFTLSESVGTASAGLSAAGAYALAQAAVGVAGGGSLVGVVRPEVATLFHQGVRIMFLTKLKIALAAVCMACVVAGGATATAYYAARAENPALPQPAKPAAKDEKKDLWRGHEISTSEKSRKTPQHEGPAVIKAADGESVLLGEPHGQAKLPFTGSVLVFPETKVTIDGKPARASDLGRGMKVQAARVVFDTKTQELELVYIMALREAAAEFTLEAVDPKGETVTITVLGTKAPQLILPLDPKAELREGGKDVKRDQLRIGSRAALTLGEDGRTVKAIHVK